MFWCPKARARDSEAIIDNEKGETGEEECKLDDD